jgi:hypothetical protein
MATEVEREALQARSREGFQDNGRQGRDRGPLLTAGAQTRLSWARSIHSWDELPEPYRAAVASIVVGGRLPAAVLTPAFPVHRDRTREHLVFRLADCLHVLQRHGSVVHATAHPISSLHAVVVGEVLLDGWLILRGRADDGSLASSALRFNAATMELLLPFIAAARPAPGPADAADPRSHPKLAWLSARDFKFHGIAREVVRPGDRVIDLVFQPLVATRVPWLPVWLFRRTRTVAHLALLTAGELILVADTPYADRPDREHLGSIRTHVRLDGISGVELGEDVDGLVTLRLELPAGDHVAVIYEAEARAEVEQLLDNLVAVAPHVARS